MFKFHLWLTVMFLGLGCALRAESGTAPLLAVHGFSVSPDLEKAGVTGWWAAERLENALSRSDTWRVVTRARIAKVLKEKNVSEGPEMKPEAMAKIAGAEYLVTGRIDLSGGRMTISVSMIGVTVRTGEIVRSFESFAPFEAGSESIQASKLLDELSKMLSMTPGQFLDAALASLRRHDYSRAAQAVRELNKLVPLDLADRLADAAGDVAMPAGETPGHIFDTAAAAMKPNIRSESVERAFAAARKLSGLARYQDLIPAVAQGSTEKEKQLDAVLRAARKKYQDAITVRNGKDVRQDPGTLCDDAVSLLRAFASNPPVALEPSDRNTLEALTGEIENYRKQLFAGPSAGRGWVVPDLNLSMVPVAPGFFVSKPAGPAEDALEHPCTVKVTRQFWIGTSELNAGQYRIFLQSLDGVDKRQRYDVEKEVMLDHEECPLDTNLQYRSGFGADYPMAGVTWRGAKLFCQWLTRIERAAGRLPKGYEYRLPTEAEWEYAARSGCAQAYSFGENTADLSKFANYKANSDGKPAKCGTLQPNVWGLFDIHGNVWEWCNDWYIEKFPAADCSDPVGPNASAENCKVLRGGSFSSSPEDLRCDARYQFEFNRGRGNIGFRVVCAPAL